MTPLHLTLAEQSLFKKLPASLQEGWEVKEETSQAYETDEQLQMRFQMASFKKDAAVQNLATKLQAGKQIEKLSLDAVPAHFLQELYFTIGARGVTTFMAVLLQNLGTDEDVQALAGLSQIRHEILQTNESVSYVS